MPVLAFVQSWWRPGARSLRGVRWVFLRALGAIHWAAFGSLRRQVLALYGSRGVMPIRESLDRARQLSEARGQHRYASFPTVFWFRATDATLLGACGAGRLAALALTFNVAPRAALLALGALYLSFVSVGRRFLAYQWDALLLETTASALLVAPRGWRPRLGREEPSMYAVLLLRSLAFRIHFQSGLAKLRSGDRAWRDGSACRHHFETQPLPTPGGWHVHQLNAAVHRLATRAVLVMECAVPFLAFAPRRLRRLGFALLSSFQGAIAITGNFGFFNFLTASSTLWLLDDSVLPRRWTSLRGSAPQAARMASSAAGLLGGGAMLLRSIVEHMAVYGPRPPPRRLLRASDATRPLYCGEAYGLFGVVTPNRREIVIEGSDDGVSWIAYRFRYKPIDERSAPAWIAPHQPRLDWQLWFAAHEQPPEWFERLLLRLLEGAPEVLELFEAAPFGARPPKQVRAMLYALRMTDRPARRRSGAWWRRDLLGVYFPPVKLESGSLVELT